MLAGFATAIAADPGADPQALRFVYESAVRVKDEKTLEYLARNPAVPDDVASALDASPIARVMVARLSLPGASADKLEAAAKDKRMGVGVAVASAVGLPDGVYETVVSSNRHPAVLSALIANVSAPATARLQAASVMGLMKASGWGTSYSKRYNARARLGEFMNEFPSFAHMLVDKATVSVDLVDTGLLALALAAPGVTPEQLAKVGENVAAGIAAGETSSRSRRYHSDSSISEVAKALASFSDTPAEAVDLIEKAYTDLGLDAQWELRSFLSAKSLSRTRAAMPVATVDTSDDLAVPEKELRALLGQAMSIKDRVRVAANYDLTDDQFVRVLLERSSGWTFSAEYADSPKFRTDVTALCIASKDSPVRLAALMLKMPWTFLDKPTVLARAHEVASHVSSLATNDHLNRGPRDEWLRMVLAHGLDDEMASCVSAKMAMESNLYVCGLDAPEVSKLWTAEVSRYLWSRFGDQMAAWDVFMRVSNSAGLSLADATATSLDTLS